MSALDDAPRVQPHDRQAWRAWLEANHATASGVWLVTWRAGSGRPGLDYEAAVEEAVCFGWIDGQFARLDERRNRLYFAPRRPRSGWASSNKARIERLAAAGLMAPAGLAAVERAKADGSWTLLDAVERLEVPPDLRAALEATPPAAANWEGFTPSARRQFLYWIATARRPGTRAARISETVRAAAEDRPAKEPRGGG